MKIVIPAPILTNQAEFVKLRSMGAEIYQDRPASRQELIERIKDAEIVTINTTIGITAETIDACPRLKYIVVPAVGYESVDLAKASEKSIVVMNCPTHNSQAVAEFAIGLLIAANRRIVEANLKLREGKWNDELAGGEMSGKKLGLVGYGNIGKRIARIAEAFDVSASYVNSKSSDREIDELLAESDFVCVCAPLNDKTHHLLNKERLNLLKPSAILVNVARGGLIDQPALIDILRAGRIAAAGLDVFEGEAESDTPNAEILQLAALPNVVATPHIAYASKEAVLKLEAEITSTIESCLAGQPINVVSR